MREAVVETLREIDRYTTEDDFTPIAQALDEVPPQLGSVVRAGRDVAGLSVRELARRAGVSEAQISRIENGKTPTPTVTTTDGIAAALGRHRTALGVLAQNTETFAFVEESLEALAEGPAWLRERHDPDQLKELPDGTYDDEAVRRLARDMFLHRSVLSHLWVGWLSEFGSRELTLREVVSSWAGLTVARRQLCVSFVRDQLRLSELDREEGIER